MKIGIFIDIDGTLCNNQKHVSNFDQNMINKIGSNPKFLVYLITGKSLFNTMSYYKLLNLKTKLITSTGQIITNPFLEKVVQSVFTKQNDFINISSFLKNKTLLTNFLIEVEEGQYFMQKVEHSNLSYIVANNKNILLYHQDMVINNIIGSYFELQNIKLSELKKLVIEINKNFPGLQANYWHTVNNPYVLQIRPYGIDKGSALAYVKQVDQLDKTIVFGNGQADIPMFKKSDISFAMKNSFTEVKNWATDIAKKDNNNSGVGYELEKILKGKNTSFY